MKLLIPDRLKTENLISTNVPENDHAPWAAGTTYGRGNRVISTATHTVYRSLTDSNVGNNPDLEQAALADPLIDDPNPVRWQILGATNRWRLFDSKPSVPCEHPESISVVLRPDFVFDGIAGFGIEASAVYITVVSDEAGTVYTKTLAMQDDSFVRDWYSYYFKPISQLTEFVVVDVPPYGDATVTITITRASGTVRCGQLLVGSVREIGEAVVGQTGFRGLDFSRVEQDEFGNLTTVRRAATRISDFEVFMPNSALLGFDSLMRDLRGGVAAVWIGDDDPRKAAVNYGYPLDYRVVYETSQHSVLSLQIQGIV